MTTNHTMLNISLEDADHQRRDLDAQTGTLEQPQSIITNKCIVIMGKIVIKYLKDLQDPSRVKRSLIIQTRQDAMKI